jgi:hypothetical protein
LGHLRWASEEPAGYVVSYTLQTYLKHDPVTVALPWSLRESISYTYSLMLFLNCPKAPQTDARYNYLWYGHKYNNVSAASSLGMKLKTNTLFRYAYLPMAGIIPRSIDKIFESHEIRRFCQSGLGITVSASSFTIVVYVLPCLIVNKYT